jgi:two-component system response regulator NreC
MAETRVLLVDDHAVLRAGLRLLLEAQPDLRVVGEAGDGREALTLAIDQHPDLVLLDLTLPGLSGLETLAALRKVLPAARVLILTMHDDEGYLRQALRQGARGYVLKKAADTELIAAVRAVLRGEVYVQSAMTAALLDTLLPAQTGAAPEDPWQTLTERERETLLLVARGHTSAQIGDQLTLSPKTIETYRARGLEKLGLRSRAALVQFVLARRLLT